MKFYGRDKEIAALRREREMSHKTARFTVITGRRRVGKTELIRQAFGDGRDDCVYLLLGRENEKTLCARLQGSHGEAMWGLTPWKPDGFVKVITGLRRCGWIS